MDWFLRLDPDTQRLILIVSGLLSGIFLVGLWDLGTRFVRGLLSLLTDAHKKRQDRLHDEQEHRQSLEQAQLKSELALKAATKLDEVISIVVADRAVGEAIREQIDAIHPPKPLPKIRVEDPGEEILQPIRSYPEGYLRALAPKKKSGNRKKKE